MARPEHIADIDSENIEFACVEIEKINTDPSLLKGFVAFLEAVTKAGAVVDTGGYRGVRFLRAPSLAEQENQLRSAQSSWDEGKRQYDILASVGECEHSWNRSDAKAWAEKENMPFPPPHEPISDFDAVVKSIDEVTA